MNPGFVVAMGMVTVFVGLIVLIVLCNLLGRICSILDKVEQKMDQPVQQAAPAAAPATAAAAAPTDGGIANRQEFIAAVSAVIAEEMGTDVSAIRILSVKKIG